ncbi:cyclic nucleotide-binding domain-containing protein [Bradyrhizobium sp. AUGA SZCCT0283]|nr:cyclic nucleotide-binding domain-containing protein [Bradyrhizobium sp. AUGA SZCCT0283]
MSSTEMAGYLAAFLVFLTFYMKTNPTSISWNLQQPHFHHICISWQPSSGFGPASRLATIEWPTPSRDAAANKEVRGATQADLSMDWLKPFTSMRRFKRGDVLFRKGDAADAMCLVVSGHFRLVELGKNVSVGQIFGELGLLAPDQLRTQTLECIEDGEVLQITYEQGKQLATKTRNLLSIFCSSRPDDCSRIFHHSNGTWPHARLQALRSGKLEPYRSAATWQSGTSAKIYLDPEVTSSKGHDNLRQEGLPVVICRRLPLLATYRT